MKAEGPATRRGEGGTPYNGLCGDALLCTFLASRYVKGVPFQGKVFERVPIFEIYYVKG